MIDYTTRAFTLATALVCSVVAAAPSANAGTQFDGRWSADFFSRTGPCKKAIHIEAQIINGRIAAFGQVIPSGRVGSSGAVNLMGSGGGWQGVMFGRLTNNSGSGSWRIQGPNVTCSGTWSAQRS